MASQTNNTEYDSAIERLKWTQGKWMKAQERVEGFRALRNLAILDAVDAGVSQRAIADAIGISQQAVNSIVHRTGRDGATPINPN